MDFRHSVLQETWTLAAGVEIGEGGPRSLRRQLGMWNIWFSELHERRRTDKYKLDQSAFDSVAGSYFMNGRCLILGNDVENSFR